MGQEAAFVAPGRVAGHQESHHLLTSEGCSEEDPWASWLQPRPQGFRALGLSGRQKAWCLEGVLWASPEICPIQAGNQDHWTSSASCLLMTVL